MAVCDDCKQDMKTVDGCVFSPINFPDGLARDPVPYPADADGRCPDCGIAPGHYHHPGCDNEVCPKCGKRLLSCGDLDG